VRQVILQGAFEDWRNAARALLLEEIRPEEVAWSERGDTQPLLDLAGASREASVAEPRPPKSTLRIPRSFLDQARDVAAHADVKKWALLYRVLWRLTHGEPKLMENPADPDFLELKHLQNEVTKDTYRMRAFVRFRETRLGDEPWFVAWYEPEHHTLRRNETFFVDRFANMRWSILTPQECMHWDGHAIVYSAGVDRAQAPAGDHIEPLWVTYYSTIFNPARPKRRAMQAQLPRRNWKNLPEAAAIESLLREAPLREGRMLERSESLRVDESDYSLAQPPPAANLEGLREAAANCRACPLWKTASCTVFGEGPADARIVLVGEQPGDQEDRAGRPFVGPAGQLLDRALAEAGMDRSTLYVTNAVKHFKWEPRGKRRIHKTPNSRDIAACRPWLEAELAQIRPALVVALGGTAAKSLFDAPLRITEERGRILPSRFGPTLVTIHPSALLRLPEPATFEAEFARYVAELRLALGGK
jgi:DNA polymerase